MKGRPWAETAFSISCPKCEYKDPNKSEAVRDKIRKSHILEAMLNMEEAVEGLDRAEELAELDKIRKKKYEELKESSS